LGPGGIDVRNAVVQNAAAPASARIRLYACLCGALSQHRHSTVTALTYQERTMNGRDWIRRHSAATTIEPQRNGAGPAAAVRIREREATPAAGPGVPTRARRLLQPLPLVGALLVLIALIGYWSVYRATTKRTPVLVAARTLSAGSVLHSGDLRTGELAGDAR